ncbi:MAG TPA: rRNA maturation RNase YbeY [Cytophagales bacterium]|nr:rRNA maturation RNase YbeY [Cytophagales bacterium]HAA20196.1 rRNA maturation RNase YbeY [Cytophagales bacterium]HAP58941.1 rRNA maturation RNase YbeY [Cytophagales bacterium]
MDIELPEISFFSEEISFSPPYPIPQLEQWILSIAETHQSSIDSLNYIFCNDEYLHKINVDYLDHDTYTDIITFDQREKPGDPIEGDIFISVERVQENASTFSTPFDNELMRVVAHGLLHLIGFGDKSEEEAAEMRIQEERAIALFSAS